MKPFQKLEDFLGTWTLRDGSEIIIEPQDYLYWDLNGNHINDPQKDLMERKREAKL